MRWIKSGIWLILVVSLIGGCATAKNKSGLLDGLYSFITSDFDDNPAEGDLRFNEVRKIQQHVQHEEQLFAEKQRPQRELEEKLLQMTEKTQQLSARLLTLKEVDNGKKVELQKRLEKIEVEITQLQQKSLINSEEIAEHHKKAAQLDSEIKQLGKILRSLEATPKG